MFRVLDIAVSEISLDAAAVSARVNAAAAGGLTVAGIGRINSRLLVFLEESRHRERNIIYRFAPFEGHCHREITGEAFQRYSSGFSTAGIFPLGDAWWGLFAREDIEK